MPKGAPGQDYGRLLDRAKANDMGTIIIRALAGGALSGTVERHPLAMQVVDPIGSAPNFAADVARTKALEPLVREGGAANLTEFAERFVISHPSVSTMLVGYSTLDPLPHTSLLQILEHRTLMLTRWRNRNVGRSSNIGLA
jgi:aryl-alcohol dehydrogenase-like predicted oxidoreductase